jgi:hypothetical protein
MHRNPPYRIEHKVWFSGGRPSECLPAPFRQWWFFPVSIFYNRPEANHFSVVVPSR